MTNKSIKDAFQLMWDYVLAKVPTAKADDKNKFLRGDGTWAEAGSEEFVVTFTFGDANYTSDGMTGYITTCDRTFDEVRAALDAGKKCVGKIIWGSSIINIYPVQTSSTLIIFGAINYTNAVGTYSCSLNSNGNVYGYYIFLEQSGVVSSHKQSASTITAGTFAGQVVANSSNQPTNSYVVRNSKISASAENPTVIGQICWKRS